MTASTFRFKQFGISQQRTAMKLGTDAVLLGAVACVPDDGTVLDIGTGTGIVAIMAAQRSRNARITGIELNGEACADAVANAAASPWSDRIEVVRGLGAGLTASCPTLPTTRDRHGAATRAGTWRGMTAT